MAHHCRDYARTAQLRAAAGAGLPPVEPGMPAPAGTGLSRRSFLLRSVGLALSVYGAGRLAPLAAEEAVAQGPAGGRVIVQVFLEGGIDSVTFLAPTEDPTYLRLRPKLARAGGTGSGTAFSEDPRLRWHPSAAAIAALHAEGKVSVMPAVGYEHPDQSHFVSRHFYEVGALDPRLATGWLGRYLDRVGAPDNPLQGLALDASLAPALASARVPVAAVDSPTSYDFWARDVWGEIDALMLDATARIGAAHARGEPAMAQVAGAAMHTGALRAQLAPLRATDERPGFTSPVAYPTSEESDFPERLAALAAMLGAGLPLRCVAITAPGDYDTHANQVESFGEPLRLTCESLAAFQRDLEARGLADRVLIHVWSEFGRRAEENSEGTDHGAAGLGLVIGTRAAGRMIGEFPGLDVLDEHGNLRATSDFRGVYAGLLEQWLGTEAAGIVPDASRVARPQLVK
jgi:uncharacterized protein (DUF1501 family)